MKQVVRIVKGYSGGIPPVIFLDLPADLRINQLLKKVMSETVLSRPFVIDYRARLNGSSSTWSSSTAAELRRSHVVILDAGICEPDTPVSITKLLTQRYGVTDVKNCGRRSFSLPDDAHIVIVNKSDVPGYHLFPQVVDYVTVEPSRQPALASPAKETTGGPAAPGFRIVSSEQLTDQEKVAKLHQYLGENYAVAVEDNDLLKAASFNTYLEALDALKRPACK